MRSGSRKKEAVLRCIRGTDTHPDAEWVWEQLRAEDPNLGLATVYRSLKQLKSEGLICSVGMYDGQEHFDGNTAAHVHAFCDRCGRILDLSLPSPETCYPCGDVAAATGFEVRSVDLVFRGLCSDCRSQSTVHNSQMWK